MRVAGIEVVPRRLRFRSPYVTSRGTLTERETLAVSVLTRDGPVGHGEAVPLTLRGGASRSAIEGSIREAGSAVLQGREVSPESLPGLVDALAGRGLRGPALAALDIALHDLAGKAAGVPVWRLLGPEAPAPVPLNATLSAGRPDAIAREAAAWAEEGFTTFKLKVGVPGDLDQLRAVRAAVGEDALIRVDANGAWEPDRAVDWLEAAATDRLELCEQPSPGLEGLASVRSRVEVPIAADESIETPADAVRAESVGACDLVTVKLQKAGGIRAALDVGRALDAWLSSAIDGPVGIAAALHVAQALGGPPIAHGLATLRLLEVAGTPASWLGPLAEVPLGPGLGLEDAGIAPGQAG